MYLVIMLVVVKCGVGEMLDKIPWTLNICNSKAKIMQICAKCKLVFTILKKQISIFLSWKEEKETGQHAIQLHMLPSVALQLYVFYY